MLNNINSRGLSKCLEFSWRNQFRCFKEHWWLVEQKSRIPNCSCWYKWPNKYINLLSNVKKIVDKTNKTSLDTVLTDTYSRLKNSIRKKISLISNDIIKEEHLGIKSLHLNRKGKNLCQGTVKFYWGASSSPLGDSYYELEIASNTIIINSKLTLMDIRISNINRLVFGHLNIKS